MKWIERIENKDGRLAPIYVGQDGGREVGSLRDAKSAFPRRGYCTAELENVRLDSFEVTDGRQYLDGIGLTGVDARDHAVYALRQGARTILIPALVILQALIGRLNAVGDRLLQAASLDSVATPVASASGALEVKFHRKARLTQDTDVSSVQARFLWLTCFPSARRLWDSVFQNAIRGQLALEMPKALVSGALVGHRTAEFVYVTRMSISSLEPCEKPLPFAAALSAEKFVFYDSGERACAALDAYRRNTPVRTTVRGQADIPLRGPTWKTTTREWHHVIRAMKLAGHTCPSSGKESVDIALEKLGGRRPWTTMGPKWRNATSMYLRWTKTGQWEILKSVLVALRAASSETKETSTS